MARRRADCRRVPHHARAAEERLSTIEAQQRAAAGRDPLGGIAGRADAAQVWERLDLGRRRAILCALVVVAVLPQGAGRMADGSRFDTGAVRVEPVRQ